MNGRVLVDKPFKVIFNGDDENLSNLLIAFFEKHENSDFLLPLVNQIEIREYKDNRNFFTKIFSQVIIQGKFLHNEGDVIELNPKILDSYEEVEKVVSHELIHLLQYKVNYFLRRIQKHNDDLSKSKDSFNEVNIFIKNFFIKVLSEGLAYYIQTIVQGKIEGFVIPNSIQQYRRPSDLEARRSVELLKTKILHDINPKENKKVHYNPYYTPQYMNYATPYIVGYEIVSLLVKKGKYTFEDLLSMNIKKFYESYVELAMNNEIEPLMSYDSSKGILDYRSLYLLWNKERKKNKT